MRFEAPFFVRVPRFVAALVVLIATVSATAAPSLPPPPAPLGVPTPGPSVPGVPYAPQPIVPGGVVIPLYPPDSPYLNAKRISEAETYHKWNPNDAQIGYVINIHNPSIEFHAGNGQLNTGATIILAAGGAHKTLGVVGEGADFVHYFSAFGINTVILRNRLRSDGYEPKVDGVNDALQAIKLVRAHAKDWNLDPNKIGIIGFSAGAELAAATTLSWTPFDEKNKTPDNPLADVSSRPDFAGLIYPGPSPFAFGGKPEIPRNAPPVFIACPGYGDRVHAIWATEYYDAMIYDGVPNVEMHLYGRGKHPGDKSAPNEPPSSGGLTNRGGIPFGTWTTRYIEWFRDLGFLGAPGVETQAARDIALNLDRKPFKWGPPPAAPKPEAAPEVKK